MSHDWVRRFARGLWVLVVLLTVGGVAVLRLDRAHYTADTSPLDLAIYGLVALIYVSVGALIVSRRSNAVGWLFCVMATGLTLFTFGSAYAVHGLVVDPGSLPGATFAAWLVWATLVPGLAPVILVFLLFPDGHPPTRRWRPVAWITLAGMAGLTVAAMFGGRYIGGPWSELGAQVRNPAYIPHAELPGVGGIAIFAGAIASMVSMIVRYRRSKGEERQQLRWMAFVPAATLVVLATTIVIGFIANLFEKTAVSNVAGSALWGILPFFIFIGVPIAAGISILRYHLYDLDLVVKKTVVFGALTATLTVVYLVVAVAIPTLLVGVGSGGRGVSVPSLVGALFVAVAFQPLRTRARRLADRLVYGDRASPYDVLSEFSERMSETYATDDVLPRMVQILAGATGAEHAGVWLRVGGSLRLDATWPDGATGASVSMRGGDDLPALPADDAIEVRHQGELLGALTASMPANDPINPAKDKLIRDLASQAGLVLRNVRLIEELRASRQRLVSAQDEERRKIERNLHDGAQQQLVALSVQMKLARTILERDPGKAAGMLDDAQGVADEALQNLRDLARGIYPPLLADQGLTAALEAQARKSPIAVSVDGKGIGRYGQDVEAAVYFCALEALQNVAKYAEAATISVRLHADDGHLTFEVTDDGRGFDRTANTYGTGLQGMADRLDSIGGKLDVRSAPGEGTTVTGRIRT